MLLPIPQLDPHSDKTDWTALGVQWHPERPDFDNTLAGTIIAWFISVLLSQPSPAVQALTPKCRTVQ